MISSEALDPMLQELRRLRPLSPDPARAERVRARCHAQLARNRRSAASSTLDEVARYVFAPAMFGCLCVLYLAGLVGAALRLRSLFD